MRQNPSYLVKNRLGIYYFSYRVPKIWGYNTRIIRKSLSTRDKKQAVKLSRHLMVFMDRWNDIAKKYFADEAEFKQAFEQYQNLQVFEKQNATAILERENALNEPEHIQRLLIDGAVIEYQEKNINLQLLEQLKIYNEARSHTPLTYENVSQSEATSKPVTEPQTNKKIDKPLEEVITEWLETRETLVEDEEIRNKTYKEYVTQLQLFTRIISEYLNKKELMCSDISIDAIKHYRDVFPKLPTRINTGIRKGKTIAQLLSMGKGKPKEKLIEMGLKPVSNKVFSDNRNTVVMMLNWARLEQYTIDLMIIEILKNIKISNKPEKTVIPFSKEQLKTFYESDKFQTGKGFKYSSDYWVPLICLFTGARLGEVAQLHTDDIYKHEETGLWVIDFLLNDIEDPDYYKKEQKRLKNSGSNKIVPIHPELKKLGLLDYHSYIKEKDVYKLFPDETAYEESYGLLSKRLGTYRNGLGIKAPNNKTSVVFHSLRHNVRTKFTELNIEEGLIDDIVGHESKERSVGNKIYNHADRIKDKNKALLKLKYDLDLNKVCRWDKCNYHRDQFRKKR